MKKIYTVLALLITLFSHSQIVNIPDPVFKAKLLAITASSGLAWSTSGVGTKVDINGDGNIQVSEALLIAKLTVESYGTNSITDLTGISSFTNLKELDFSSNAITTVDLSGLTLLEVLNCNSNQLTSLDISSHTHLHDLDCGYNALTSLNITNDIALTDLVLTNNQIQNIDLTSFVNLNYLVLNGNPFTSALNLGNLVNLEMLFAENITGVCPLTDAAMPNLTSLTSLKTDSSSFGNIHYNLIPNLELLLCRNTGLTTIDFIPRNIQSLAIENNQVTTLDFSDFTNLEVLNMATNPVTSLTFGNHPALTTIYASRNNLTDIDVSSLPALTYISVNNCPNLVTYNVKNGIANSVGTLINCPNLRYICGDDSDLTIIQNAINSAGLTNCHVNSYCTFGPGGTSYAIQGNHKWDIDNNGCDSSDFLFPNMKFTISNGTSSGTLISGNDGLYQIDVPAGTYTLTPVFENPTYFNVTSSNTGNIVFPTAASPYIRDFCVRSNGAHSDLEITIVPIGNARAGLDANYKIVYKNKGNNTQSGSINLAYNDAVLDFVSATPSFDSQTTNNLVWNFSNLLPFETRIITLSLNLNSPIETPPLNSGDILTYTANILGLTDETPNDNSSALNQTVRNSFDPNDKTCVEGTTVTPDMAGKYVHYVIRFENTGTANAQNVVVKDVIDTAKFDITTLMPLTGSHPFETRIKNTNQVEFIFENINLPFDNANNDGFVAFKIKTKPTLVVGDTFSNSANIYFDYNFPITTNTYTTTIATLGIQDFEFNTVFSLSPVPAKDNLTITTKQDVVMSSVSIYNTLGQLVQVNTNPSESIDVSDLKTGSYFIKIISDKGTASSKFIKE